MDMRPYAWARTLYGAPGNIIEISTRASDFDQGLHSPTAQVSKNHAPDRARRRSLRESELACLPATVSTAPLVPGVQQPSQCLPIL